MDLSPERRGSELSSKTYGSEEHGYRRKLAVQTEYLTELHQHVPQLAANPSD